MGLMLGHCKCFKNAGIYAGSFFLFYTFRNKNLLPITYNLWIYENMSFYCNKCYRYSLSVQNPQGDLQDSFQLIFLVNGRKNLILFVCNKYPTAWITISLTYNIMCVGTVRKTLKSYLWKFMGRESLRFVREIIKNIIYNTLA